VKIQGIHRNIKNPRYAHKQLTEMRWLLTLFRLEHLVPNLLIIHLNNFKFSLLDYWCAIRAVCRIMREDIQCMKNIYAWPHINVSTFLDPWWSLQCCRNVRKQYLQEKYSIWKLETTLRNQILKTSIWRSSKYVWSFQQNIRNVLVKNNFQEFFALIVAHCVNANVVSNLSIFGLPCK
jgi:hypothetical protein